MRNAALLVGFYATTACSLDHVVVATLDSAGAGGWAIAGRTSSAGAGGSAGGAPSAGSGGSVFSGGSPAGGDAGGDSIASGGVVDTHLIGTIIGAGGGASETRCSCIGRRSELCGTDGITYPSECVDTGACLPPGIACLQACPCPDGAGGNATTTTSDWFLMECASSAHCSEGVICMAFSGGTFNDEPTPCVGSN